MKQTQEQKQVLEICRRLRVIREEQGISQQRLSEMAGMSRTGLRHIESMEISPTLYSLLKISKALKIDLTRILRESTNEKPPG